MRSSYYPVVRTQAFQLKADCYARSFPRRFRGVEDDSIGEDNTVAILLKDDIVNGSRQACATRRRRRSREQVHQITRLMAMGAA